MKHFLLYVFLLNSLWVNSQIISGEYENNLKLAYNPSTRLITGFFESYTGNDENTGTPSFSCIFYISGICEGSLSDIKTYYPKDKDGDLITGKIKVSDPDKISIKLPEEHGGCWNVMHFADDSTEFSLLKEKDWIEIRYIDIAKSYFYREQKDESIRKAYLVKGDIVYIDKLEQDWVHCMFYGKTMTKGWLKRETLNK